MIVEDTPDMTPVLLVCKFLDVCHVLERPKHAKRMAQTFLASVGKVGTNGPWALRLPVSSL